MSEYDAPTTKRETYLLEMDVVEAARGLLNDNLPLQMRVDHVVETVRALERVEGE
jgi:hypothetical protein